MMLNKQEQKFSQNKQKLQAGKILCSQNNPARFTCFSKNCDKSSILCEQKSCTCHNDHKGCLMLLIQNLLESFQSKIPSSKQFQECLSSQIDKIIDYLSDFREKMLAKTKQFFIQHGVSKDEWLIMKCLGQGKTQKLIGKKIFQCYLNSKQMNIDQQKFNRFINKVQTHFQDLKRQVQGLTILFEKQIQFYLESLKSSQQNFKFGGSKIVNSTQDIQTLLSFFQPKQIKNLSLLYRASQNDFSLNKFHEKCGDISNTLILVDQEFGNKIGGFTSLPWKRPAKDGKDVFVKDQQKQSFIFSLKHKDKLTLFQLQNAIEQRNNGQLRFGRGSDLIIYDRANENKKSFANVGYSYQSNRIKQPNSESRKRFVGSPNGEYYFRVDQWEVWKVQFI